MDSDVSVLTLDTACAPVHHWPAGRTDIHSKVRLFDNHRIYHKDLGREQDQRQVQQEVDTIPTWDAQ